MKISSQQLPGVVGSYLGKQLRKPAGPTTAAAGDQLVLSEKAVESQALQSKLAAVADVRGDKVAQLQRSIADGTYRPDLDAVAERVLKRRVLGDLPE